MELRLENLPRTVEIVCVYARKDSPDACPGYAFRLLDQRKLPYEISYILTSSWRVVRRCICELAVRGAPAIGVAGAAAVALAALELSRVAHGCDPAVALDAGPSPFSSDDLRDAAYEKLVVRLADASRSGESSDLLRAFKEAFDYAIESIAAARPTAVNLEWAVRRAARCATETFESAYDIASLPDALLNFARNLEEEDEAVNRAIGAHGAQLLRSGSRVLTHCNAGSLATAFYGTALGVVYAAAQQGKISRVFADETRPVGQGSRLTVWELSRAGVPVTLICDNMAASVMASGSIDAVIVGADRITACGDVANKIGTYGVALLARAHGIPFYVAAPASTIDFSLDSGCEIVIEQRDPAEVLPNPIEGVDVLNPAFDVTPSHLIDRIITEHGAIAPDELRAFYGRGEREQVR